VDTIKYSGIFYERAYQENKRETWSVDRLKTEVYIDTWPGLPTYFEVESKTEEMLQKTIQEMGLKELEKSGLIKSTIESVACLYAEKYNIDIQTMLDEKCISFKNLPAWAMLKI
jgi:hypothetical protein